MVDFNKALAGAGKAISDFGTSVSKKAKSVKAYGREICSKPTEGIKKVATDAGNASLGALKSFGKTIERDFKSLTTNHKKFEKGTKDNIKELNDFLGEIFGTEAAPANTGKADEIAKTAETAAPPAPSAPAKTAEVSKAGAPTESAAPASTEQTEKTAETTAPVAPPTAKETEKTEEKTTEKAEENITQSTGAPTKEAAPANTAKTAKATAPAAPPTAKATKESKGFLGRVFDKKPKTEIATKEPTTEETAAIKASAKAKELGKISNMISLLKGHPEILNTEGVFRISGSALTITDAVKSEEPHKTTFPTVHEAVGTLKKLLFNSEQHRIPQEDFNKVLEFEGIAQDKKLEFAKELISKLPPEGQQVIRELSDLAKDIIANAKINKMDSTNLAIASTGNFMPKDYEGDLTVAMPKLNGFFAFVYTNHDAISPPPPANPEFTSPPPAVAADG